MFFGIWVVLWQWAVGFSTDEGLFARRLDDGGWEFSINVVADDGSAPCDGDCDGCDCL